MKILIATFNSAFGEYISYRLERDGHNVTLVTDGLEALRSLKQESWDLLVISIALNYLTGLEVLKQYQDFLNTLSEEEKALEKYHPVPVVVVTRIRNEKIRKNARALGVSDYLLLPLKTSLLLDKINSI